MEIRVSPLARKQLKKVPSHIKQKFDFWCDLINFIGIREARKYKGFHDEPLLGKRRGQRSVRLSKAYRLIYVELDNGTYEIIDVLEINKHDY